MMEGVASEAASIAGHLKLVQPVLDLRQQPHHHRGPHRPGLQRGRGARFEGYGWNVIHVDDANDTAGLAAALQEFEAITDRPTLIVVHSIIGYGAPQKAGTAKAHGEPLGEEEIKAAKTLLRLAGGRAVPGARRRA